MATLKQTAYTVSIVVCLVLFPCGAFGAFDENPIIHSAEGALATLKRIQIRCEVGFTYSEYARALGDVQSEIDKIDEDFRRYVEKALTMGSRSLYFDVSTCSLLADLHHAMSFHELVKGWWGRLIEKQVDPTCLDLMSSDEWEELTLLLEDAGDYLERMKQSLP